VACNIPRVLVQTLRVMPNVVAEKLSPPSRSVFLVSTNRSHSVKRKREKLDIMCGDVFVCVSYSFCQVAGGEVLSVIMK
jgi:hypothetical protein